MIGFKPNREAQNSLSDTDTNVLLGDAGLAGRRLGLRAGAAATSRARTRSATGKHTKHCAAMHSAPADGAHRRL